MQHFPPPGTLFLANSYSYLKTQIRSLLLQEALLDLQVGSDTDLGSPNPGLHTLAHHSLVTGLSSPLDSELCENMAQAVMSISLSPAMSLTSDWGQRIPSPVVLVKNPPADAGDLSDTGSIPVSGRSPGEGNGNPLQYSCLENLMDREAWWAIVHGLAKGWTQLSN